MRPDEIRLIKHLQQLNIEITVAQYEKLFVYLQKLLITNQTTNLTAITDYSEALVKHLFDSLIILDQPVFINANNILDVGSGAGLPSIPLAICHPEKRFFSLEATRKKVNFQQQACEELDIKNHFVFWGRAEEYAHDRNHREQYDLVLARALAATDTLAELTLPFVALDQYAIYYKAKEYLSELQNAEKAIKLLGGLVIKSVKTDLPDENGTRSLIMIKKLNTTPKNYPRRSGLPQKAPLK
jgi:16S rRNA (guanine527-N7)-methyltransferase